MTWKKCDPTKHPQGAFYAGPFTPKRFGFVVFDPELTKVMERYTAVQRAEQMRRAWNPFPDPS